MQKKKKAPVKLRFWQKTYLLTLALFLLCMNAGILSLTAYTHRKNVEAVESAIRAEQSYVAMTFEKEYRDMLAANPTASSSLLMQSFGAHYGKNGCYLAFYRGETPVFSNFTSPFSLSSGSMRHLYFEEERYLLVSSPVVDGLYDFYYAKNISTLDRELRELLTIYALTALGVSLLLATVLYFILKKLSAPLEKLRKTTECIEAGDFTVTADAQGHDEFTLLAGSFNRMLATIREQMDALELTAERKQLLVDNMAHELRTPLTSIHGYAELLEKAAISEEQRIVAAKYILSEATRLQKISELLLDSAYIRENRPALRETDLAGLLRDTAARLSRKAAAASVTLHCDPPPATVRSNETLLSMLFYNLTENALKACAPGGSVTLTLAPAAEQSPLTVLVTDTGKGMTAEQLSHITEPFYRTDKSRSRAEGGAGLGLALCKQIADALDMTLEFSSKPGIGTEVRVIFTSR